MKQERREKKEIRSILLGRTLLTEDGRLTGPDPGMLIVPQGVVNGAGVVRFVGVKGTRRYYASDREEDQLMAAAEQGMRNIGRAVFLREQPEAAACLLRYLMTRPAVLSFQYVEGVPTLTVWTGRGLLGWVTRLRAFSAFERELSEALQPAAAPVPEKKKRKRRAESAAESAAPAEEGDDIPAEERTEEPAEEEYEENGFTEEDEISEEDGMTEENEISEENELTEEQETTAIEEEPIIINQEETEE